MTDAVPHARPERWLVATTEYAGLTAYTGGIGRHLAALLPALVARGIDVDLVVFSADTALPDVDLGGVRIVGFVSTAGMPRLIELPLRTRRLRTILRRRGYDRVFLPEWGGLGSALARSAPLVTNLATSMRIANAVSGLAVTDLPRLTRLVVAMQNRLEDRQIERSAGLISISHAMLSRTETLFRRLPPARVVGNCIDVDGVAAAALHAPVPAGWPDGDAPVVLFLGRLERRKGVTDAVAAFGAVSARFGSARLVLAGASGDRRFEPDRAELLAAVPPEARERVVWLGHVGGDELYRAIATSAVVLCPSRWEGFGNVALEVKAIGRPLVCTTGSGFDDFCTDGEDSLMVPPDDPAALAEAIGRILDDDALATRLGDTARVTARRYTPTVIASELVSAVDELLGPPERHQPRPSPTNRRPS